LLTVTVTDENVVALENIENGVQLVPGVTYKITLSLPGSTSSGYCLITTEGGETYFTDYVLRHEDATPHTDSFLLTVGEAQTVSFEARWGIFTHDSSVVEIDGVKTITIPGGNQTTEEDAPTDETTVDAPTDETTEDLTTDETTEDASTDETTEDAPTDETTEDAPTDETTEDLPTDETTEEENQ
jgi:hypothetical protein